MTLPAPPPGTAAGGGPAPSATASAGVPDRTAVAVLGLGAMGLPMATHLSTSRDAGGAGLDVRGYDLSQARLDLATTAGVSPAPSAADAARGADVVLVAVRDQDQLDELLFGEPAVAASMSPGAVVVLTSTVGEQGARAVAARLCQAGVGLVDAPVSGGPKRAGAGDLLVVVGADDQAWEAAHDVLEAMSSTLVRVGREPGSGQAMKTVNQLLCGIHIAAAAEALALARALGLDPRAALEALMAGAASSFMLGDRGPRMLQALQACETERDDGARDPREAEGVEVRSRLDIFVKDMGIVTAAARGAGLPTPVAAAAEQLYLQGASRGLAARDDSSVITVLAPGPGSDRR
ncbi:NAD(P)-dependent oxidoreductase [Actinomyces sp. 2119]|uniref:NAD(P)-dependent oxidoreductase n=1 Tax=Actinomyces sp. 2119 TaxID=2321393 RepID=UPI000E6B845B|nr:NAD(P)-dependent oxidoreductase [Actinomyces sp. 2119]RJF41912.1 NAD(P)-dependent oxidoreductase [Actinomyces sp. 2119]